MLALGRWRTVIAVFILFFIAGFVGVQSAAAAEGSADAAPAAQFDVMEFRVLGNTVLPPADIERAVYPFLGPGKSIDDVQAARAALEQAYRSAGRGTVYVDVPEQDVEGGIVRLKVTEGQLRQVRVQGAQYFSGRQIRNALPAAAANTGLRVRQRRRLVP